MLYIKTIFFFLLLSWKNYSVAEGVKTQSEKLEVRRHAAQNYFKHVKTNHFALICRV